MVERKLNQQFGFGRPQFATKELAEAELADMIKKRGGGLSPGRRDVTFAEQAKAFLANAADGLAEKTLRSYRGHLNVHNLAYFGKRRIVEINAPMIKTFLTEKRRLIPTVKIVSANFKKPRAIDLADFDSTTMKRWTEQDADATRKLSISTLRLIRATLSVVFASAVDDRIIDRNTVPDPKMSRQSRKAIITPTYCPGVEQSYADLLDESEADWQRFDSRSNKQRIEIEKPVESV